MEKRKILISDILRMLDEGKTRKEINAELGLNPREVKVIWSHSQLVHRKPAKYSVGVELDTEERVGPSFEDGV